MRPPRYSVIQHPPCSDCGGPMMLASVEPAEKPGYDKRLFRCSVCAHDDCVTVKVQSFDH